MRESHERILSGKVTPADFVNIIGDPTQSVSAGPASPPHAAAEPEKPMNEPMQSYRFALQVIAAGEASDQAKMAREAMSVAAEPVGRPIGTLWQHGETGRKQVEFVDEPHTVAHVNGWLPVGRIYLASPSAQPIAPADAKDAARYRWLRDHGDATWIPLAKRYKAGRALDEYIDAALKSAEGEK